ncbi:hypothetical protein RSSM_05398 [Rhodopirellula sallentina SM41]|uniref:Uncharacterized protein n=1 Tax=Rhodopirellula sallentina SM41 TaxID=1263870 RepID=M5TVW1_9BACT|nr:hypothetical protein RSSM_05398 [Rhodopirellula sallentina SM41]
MTVVPFPGEFGTLTTQRLPQKFKPRSSELPAEGSKRALRAISLGEAYRTPPGSSAGRFATHAGKRDQSVDQSVDRRG